MFVLDWSLIVDWILRYYFPVLVLIPMTMILCFVDRHLTTANRKTVMILCLMLLALILVDVINEPLSRLPVFSPWRLVVSVMGFCLRPACLLVLLLDSMPDLRQSRKKMILVSLPAVINVLVFCSSFFAPTAVFFDAENNYHRGPLYFVVILVSILYMILLAVFALTGMKRRSRHKTFAILTITVACFLASFLEMNGVAYPTPLLNQTIAIGTTLYFLIQYMVVSTETIENMSLSMLLMQIRPHFINNSLAAIRGMIRRDPEKAAEALNHFSGYLQDSMNSILTTEFIPLDREMDLIDNYLYMENTRFNNSITVTKELTVDLLVPPLTVQPLVENAVRHGLRGLQRPGELLIRTEADRKEVRIIVRDNGCGFDPTQPPDPRRPHVGMKNVRSRLELLCSGTLTVESSPAGTVATIRIPANMARFISPASSSDP